MNQPYEISVYCLVYNHAAYIRQALDGFISQKTNFKFKVIVHDDASTDGSQEIIKQYAARYPDIIFPICQTENQYSKGVKIFADIIAPRIDTKYVAVCEGDDYWCDENKLQLQFDYMESHPDCRLCTHDTKIITSDGCDTGRLINGFGEHRDYDTCDVIAAGGSGLFHTSSVLYRFADRLSLPSELTLPRIGDYPLAIYLSSLGEVHYMGRVMSARRINVGSSWTARNMRDKEKACAHYEMMLQYLKTVDEYFNYQYHAGVVQATVRYQYLLWLQANKVWSILFHKDTRRLFKKQYSLSRRMLMIAKGSVKFILQRLKLRA